MTSTRAIIEARFRADLEQGLTEEQVASNAALLFDRADVEDSPANLWWNAQQRLALGLPERSLDQIMADHDDPEAAAIVVKRRAAIARALRIDPSDEAAHFALHPFRLLRIADQWHIIAAWPTPTAVPCAMDPHDIEAVIAWNPDTNATEVLDDPGARLIGPYAPEFTEATPVYGQALPFFQAWARNRARWWGFRKTFRNHWTKPPEEPDLAPGLLLIGQLDRVALSPSRFRPEIECVGIDPAAMNRALLRAARVPRARTGVRIAA
jgi:hypothetical protein